MQDSDVAAPMWQLGLTVSGALASVQKLVDVFLDPETADDYQCGHCFVRSDGARQHLRLVATPESTAGSCAACATSTSWSGMPCAISSTPETPSCSRHAQQPMHANE